VLSRGFEQRINTQLLDIFGDSYYTWFVVVDLSLELMSERLVDSFNVLYRSEKFATCTIFEVQSNEISTVHVAVDGHTSLARVNKRSPIVASPVRYSTVLVDLGFR
jgi:hypothetical protein